MKNKSLIYLIILLVLIVAGIGIYYALNKSESNQIPEENGTHKVAVNLYYYNPELDKDEDGNIMCSSKGLVSVQRGVSSENTIEETLKLLIEGNLTENDKSQGITTEFPLEGVELEKTELQDGVLTVTFNDPNGLTNGGACRAGILWFQIAETAKQFSEVEEVKFEPQDGLFQP